MVSMDYILCATCCAAQGLSEQSRQQAIVLCCLSSQRLGFFDLFIEELVESGNQFLRWTLLYDGADFVSETD